MPSALDTSATDTFPEEVPALQALVRQLRSELTLEKLARQKAESKVKDLLRRMFGPKSEKFNSAQRLLFGLATAAEEAANATRAALKRTLSAAKRVRRGGGRRPSPENLPILETVTIEVPEEHREGLKHIRDEVTFENDYRPSQFFRRKIVRAVYADPKKQKSPMIGALPARVIPQSMVGPGFLSHMLVGKYVDHLPYYRQERIDARAGLFISRKARCRYTEHCAQLLLTIYGQLIERILESGYVSADETVVKLLDPDRGGKARDAWLWTYLAPLADSIVFQFSLTRSAENPQRFFPADWAGALQSDGYNVYPSLTKQRPGMVLFGCWAHARRPAVEALKSGAGEKAITLVRQIGELYQIEQQAKEEKLSFEQRGALRAELCPPIFARLHEHYTNLQREELPTSHLAQAASYSLNRWPELIRYAEPRYGHINIDQNPVEGNIRPTKIGAKNWMHIGHPKAGWRSAVIYSVVGSCRLIGVNPEAYLTWVLPQLAARQSIAELLPHDYARLHPSTGPPKTNPD